MGLLSVKEWKSKLIRNDSINHECKNFTLYNIMLIFAY